jgi:aminopeptidase N
MATYLTLIAIGRFEVDSGVTASGLPYLFAIAEGDDPEYALARKDIERTAEVVDWMAERFGPYPFDAIGAVVPDGDIIYAPEPQTRPVYGKLMWSTGESNILTVVHENAHQWFGNSVSLDQWRDIWLSESFARYAEWLWTEDHDGKTAQQLFDDLHAEHPADDPWWTFLVGEPGAGRIFEDPLYGAAR